MGKCRKVCWGVKEGEGRCGGPDVRKCVRMCGRMYGVSVGKYVGAWGQGWKYRLIIDTTFFAFLLSIIADSLL